MCLGYEKAGRNSYKNEYRMGYCNCCCFTAFILVNAVKVQVAKKYVRDRQSDKKNPR